MPHLDALDPPTKRFGALIANDDVSLSLRRGEILALLGENGAGKTTLMNILFGHYAADEGEVRVFGEALPPGKPRAAIEAGVGMVHQHFTLGGQSLTAFWTTSCWAPSLLTHFCSAALHRAGALMEISARNASGCPSIPSPRSRASRSASGSGWRSSRRSTATRVS